MTKWTEAKDEALRDPDRFPPGGPRRCEVMACGKETYELHAHHVFYHRMRKKPELDCVENMQLVCHECHHSGKADNYKNNQRAHWDYLCSVYGSAHMHAWHEALPLKAKENFGG